MINESNKKEEGYTLVELIVGVAVFILAATLISGIFVRSIRTQRQSNHLTVLNSDTGLVLEKMVREIREGYDFSNLPNNCQGVSSESLTFNRFIDGSEKVIEYRLNDNKLERREGSSSFVPLNSSQVSVEDLCFIETQERSDHPWRITVAISAGSIDPEISYRANAQTTISARPLPDETQ